MRRAFSHLLPVALLFGAAVTVAAQGFNLKAPIAAKPAFLTSVGQSADVEMVKVLMDRSGIPYKADVKVKAADLAASGAKSLVLAIGGSTKGLGAAGISAEVELERAKAVIAEARKLGMKIIGLHVGGEARRGELSDKFVMAAVPQCDYVIVVAEGNKDNLFNKLCGTKVTLDTVDKITKAGDPLAKAFIK
jgi:hypothetical protein